jgi:hypothetical protein
VCEECSFPAFFRKPSRSGRGPCFGARPHDEGCELAAVDNEARVPGVADDQDEVFNAGDRIIVELAFGGQDGEVHLDPNERGPRRPRGGRHVGEGGPRVAQMHRRLSTLLRLLVTAPNFQYSDQTIAVANQPELPARDFFVHLSNVTPGHAGQFRGYWGQLTDAGEGTRGVLWLNSGGRGDASFLLPPEFRQQVMQRFRLEEEDEFSGMYILVLGTLRVSQNGKKICDIDDPALITLR